MTAIELTEQEMTIVAAMLAENIDTFVALRQKLTAQLAAITPPPKLDVEPEPGAV
jgi:hypothetical protein